MSKPGEEATLRADTQSITVPGRGDKIFAFFRDPENLPRWAVGFCRAIHRDAESSHGTRLAHAVDAAIQEAGDHAV